MTLNITEEALRSLWDKYTDVFVLPLQDLLNPHGFRLGSFGFSRGSYGRRGWEEWLARRLKVVGLGIMFSDEQESEADRFFSRVLGYTRDTLPRFTNDDEKEITDYERRHHTSNCVASFTAGRKGLEILQEKGFYLALDRVYATLEVLATVSLGAGRDYSSEFLSELSPLADGNIQEARAKLYGELQKQKGSILDVLKQKSTRRDRKYRERYIGTIMAGEDSSHDAVAKFGIAPVDVYKQRMKAHACRALLTHLDDAHRNLGMLLGEGIRPEDVQKGFEKYRAALNEEKD